MLDTPEFQDKTPALKPAYQIIDNEVRSILFDDTLKIFAISCIPILPLAAGLPGWLSSSCQDWLNVLKDEKYGPDAAVVNFSILFYFIDIKTPEMAAGQEYPKACLSIQVLPKWFVTGTI